MAPQSSHASTTHATYRSADSQSDEDEEEDEAEPEVSVVRAELVRGHRPVVVSEVPVYIGLRDRSGRLFEDKGTSSHLRYRWMRGPVIRPCIYHPHKTSQFRDVTKTFQYYCSKECFLKGWYNLPQSLWGQQSDCRDSFDSTRSEWVQVASSKEYCPTSQDIDRPLRLDIIPLMKDGSDSTVGGLSITTGTVIPTPKEARTRRMITNGGSYNAEWLSKQFKVMNWNVLADLYATESFFPYCEKWALSWNWRKHLILKELKSMAAEIITLQEVQKDAYEEWFRPQLLEIGYESTYQQKKREPVFNRGKYTAEGCATFWKTSRFKRVEKQVIDYDKAMSESLRSTRSQQQDIDRGLQRAAKGNIALAVVLEDVSHSSGNLVCVVNTHVLADPGCVDVKLWQTHLLLQAVEQAGWNHIPLVVCGDFNSIPESAVYEYVRQGTLRSDHEDLRQDPCGLLREIQFEHTLRLTTAYETCSGKEAEYTNYTEDFKGTLDYIFFTSNFLTVLAISQVDEESQLKQETALPSSTRPSDHVSLVATFMFRDPPADYSSGQSHMGLMGSTHPYSGMYHGYGAGGMSGCNPYAASGGYYDSWRPSPNS